MLRRYELTDQEWEQIASLLSPEKKGKPRRPSKDNRTMFNGMVWIVRSGAPWRNLSERYDSWNSVYSRFRKWIDDGILDNIFWVPSLEAELYEFSLDATIVQVHQQTIPSKKGAKFERNCDWWLYKERHLVEKYFLKLKGFRHVATRYDKLAFTYMGFVCFASILIWIK